MRRNVVILFLFIIVFALISSNSYALTGTFELSSTTHTQAPPVKVHLSANVVASYAGTDGAYGAATTNPLGNGKSFGLSSATSYVYYTKVTKGTSTPVAVTAGKSTWSSSTWSVVGK